MAVLNENLAGIQINRLESIKSFLSKYWPLIIIGFTFSFLRIRYLTYPLGLMHRQPVKEGYRSYEAITSSYQFEIPFIQNLYFEQPIYVFILDFGYHLFGNTPDALVLWGRCLGFIFSALSLILVFKITELTFGDVSAKFAAFLFALSPYGISMNLAIQRETLMWLFGLFGIYFLLKYLKTKEDKYIIFNLGFTLLSVLTKVTGLYFLFSVIVSLIIFYEATTLNIKISLRIRIILLFLFFLMIGIFSLIFSITIVNNNSFSAFRHTIIFEPGALIDTEFWGNILVNSIIYLPITTVLLAGIGLFFVLTSFKKEYLALVIWTIFTGMEIVFYGYGAIIHEYYVLYLLHPLVIFAGYTLCILYDSNIKQVITTGHIPIKMINPLIFLSLLISSGFIPLFYYTGEDKMIKANKSLYEDIRSIGLFLQEYNIEGKDIGIVYLKENYEWWRFQLTLTRTYIDKTRIKEFYVSDVASLIYSDDVRAIIGWSDDLEDVQPVLVNFFGNHTIYPQKNLFRGTITLPAIELWYNPI